MANEIQIRTCTHDDIPGVLALWAIAAAPHGHPDTAAAVKSRLQRDPELFVVAIDPNSEAIVGSLMGGWDGWRGYMYRMAVLPALRRNGLATRLVDEVERRLAAIGATRIHAHVVTDSPGAPEFWAAKGYIPQPTIADYAKTQGASCAPLPERLSDL
jgi:ribosomal protein S18 acetylase RimI-like enzyme